MLSRTGSLQLRRCGGSEIGIGSQEGKAWPAGELLLASIRGPRSTHYLLAIPDAVLEGTALTTFLDRVAPFGCPPPHSLIRAYSLPDSPFPSILLKEHDEARKAWASRTVGSSTEPGCPGWRRCWGRAAACVRPWRGRRDRRGSFSLLTSGPRC